MEEDIYLEDSLNKKYILASYKNILFEFNQANLLESNYENESFITWEIVVKTSTWGVEDLNL